MNINDVFPSKFLKANELQGHTPTVTIDRVEVEAVRSRTKTETKAVLYFRGKVKGMLLNKTNARSVTAIAASARTEDWVGVAVTLYETTATFGTEVHPVIRIQAPAAGAGSRPRIVPPQRLRAVDEIEIDLQDREARS